MKELLIGFFASICMLGCFENNPSKSNHDHALLKSVETFESGAFVSRNDFYYTGQAMDSIVTVDQDDKILNRSVYTLSPIGDTLSIARFRAVELYLTEKFTYTNGKVSKINSNNLEIGSESERVFEYDDKNNLLSEIVTERTLGGVLYDYTYENEYSGGALVKSTKRNRGDNTIKEIIYYEYKDAKLIKALYEKVGRYQKYVYSAEGKLLEFSTYFVSDDRIFLKSIYHYQ